MKFKFIKYIPLVITIVILVMFGIFSLKKGITVENILHITPDNLVLSILFLWTLFALKSLSVIFPIAMLYLASGIIFPAFISLFVSITGLLITVTIPYIIGRCCGDRFNSRLYKKYPDINKISFEKYGNDFSRCFITRVVGVLPTDVVSAYWGAHKIPFGTYAAGSVLGSMLSLVTTTLLGNKIRNPFSLGFQVILGCRILLIVFSVCYGAKMKNGN